MIMNTATQRAYLLKALMALALLILIAAMIITMLITTNHTLTLNKGIIFAPKNDAGVNAIKEIFEVQASLRGMKVLGWRSIETGLWCMYVCLWIL